MRLRWLDAVVVLVYLTAILVIGLRFARTQTSTETYFVAKRCVPGVGIGHIDAGYDYQRRHLHCLPGAGYAGNWSLLVPGIMVIVVPAIACFVVIPFYRQVIGMSTYEYFGKRFGYPARVYSALAFALGTFSKMAFVVYLLALTITSMTGLRVDLVIVAVSPLPCSIRCSEAWRR